MYSTQIEGYTWTTWKPQTWSPKQQAGTWHVGFSLLWCLLVHILQTKCSINKHFGYVSWNYFLACFNNISHKLSATNTWFTVTNEGIWKLSHCETFKHKTGDFDVRDLLSYIYALKIPWLCETWNTFLCGQHSGLLNTKRSDYKAVLSSRYGLIITCSMAWQGGTWGGIKVEFGIRYCTVRKN